MRTLSEQSAAMPTAFVAAAGPAYSELVLVAAAAADA